MHLATINDSVMHYADLPGGSFADPVIVSGSLGSDLRLWSEAADLLRADQRVILYDTSGHGLSSRSNAPLSPQSLATDVLALADFLDVPTFSVIGLSVGGQVAMATAGAAPSRVKGLLLCNTSHRLGSPELWSDRIALIEKNGMEGAVDMILGRWFAASFAHQRPDAFASARRMLAATDPEGYIDMAKSLRDADLSDVASNLSLPVEIIAGELDGSAPPELVAKTAALIPNSNLTIIDGIGHLPPLEAPIAIRDAMKRLNARVSDHV